MNRRNARFGQLTPENGVCGWPAASRFVVNYRSKTLS
jgi:hypothetical protein